MSNFRIHLWNKTSAVIHPKRFAEQRGPIVNDSIDPAGKALRAQCKNALESEGAIAANLFLVLHLLVRLNLEMLILTHQPESAKKASGQRRMRWKIFLGSGALLSIALVLAAYGVLATYDYNTLKPQVAGVVKDATGRELQIRGDVDLAIGLSPSLVVSDIALANAAWGAAPQMITVRSLRLQVRLLPLLFRNIIIDQIAFSGVRVLLETDPVGQHNWDLPARKPTGSLGKLKAAQIAVDRVRITDLDIIVLAPPGASKAQVTVARLTMNRQGSQDRLALSLRADYNGQAVALDGTIGSIDLLFKRRPFPVQLTATSSRATVSVSGSIAAIHDLAGVDMDLKASGQDLREIGKLIGQTLPLTDEFTLEGRLTGAAQTLSLANAQGRARRENLHLTLKGAVEGLPSLEGMNLQTRVAGRELAEIEPLLGTPLPDLGPFDDKSRLAGSFNAIALKPFSAVIDKSDFNGWTTVSFSMRPKITVRLTSSLIDFTALMKSFEMDAPKPAEDHKRPHRLFPDDPLPAEFLSKIDADIMLKATNIQARNARLNAGYLTLKLEDRELSIDHLDATYKGTKIAGDLHVKHAETLEVATRFLVQNFNLGDFLKETEKSANVRAVIDIAAHGQSRGGTVNRLMANLDGAIGFVMGEGYLTRYLNLLSVGLTEEVLKFWDPPQEADQIQCAAVQFDIHQGVAVSQAFVFNTLAGILTGKGRIDLGSERINFLLASRPRYFELSLRPKLAVSGTITEPRVTVAKLNALAQGSKALSALVVGPLGLLAPFVHLGAFNAHPCDVKGIDQNGLGLPESE